MDKSRRPFFYELSQSNTLEFFHLAFIKAVKKPKIFNALFGCPAALGLKFFAITLHTLSYVL
ncbi:MAG: hypothetical protein V2B20_24650, partial [Pseudomonadota bacterium]